MNRVPMLFTSYEKFLEYTETIEKQYDRYKSEIYYLMRFGYTLQECQKERFMLIRTEIDWDNSIFVWDWDWYEGQQFIELYDVVSDLDIIKMIGEKYNDILCI